MNENIEKVLTILDGFRTSDEITYSAYSALHDEISLLDDLLKKQEPKPVKVTKNAYGYEFYDCPNCGKSFELTYYKKPAYCDKCGQAVKWDEANRCGCVEKGLEYGEQVRGMPTGCEKMPV